LASELVRQLVDAGIHFGHRASRWNPKMAPYIFGKRNTIHIIDIRETVRGLLRAKRFLTQVVAGGKDVLFVGTKRQARLPVRQAAQRCEMPWVTERWLGGTLTNFRTIRSRLQRLEELEQAEVDGSALEYGKKMISMRAREKQKIERNLSGIRIMDKLPGALVIVDVHREHNAVREAKALGIPTICLIDTDSDPDFADVPIPGNDDAIRAISIVLNHLADAIEEGKKGRMAEQPEEKQADTRERGPRGRVRRGATARADDQSPEALAARPEGGEVPGTEGAAPRPPKDGKPVREELSPAAASQPDRPS
jgi:small subunit ribosomal protein S2